MQSSATASVDNIQARALAADEAAKQEFRSKVLSYANDFRFALKESSRLLGVSAGFLRSYAAKHGIEFSNPELRTKEEGKAIFRQYEEIRLSKEPKRVEPRKPMLNANELVLPPQLDLLSKKVHWERQNRFLERVQDLATTMTMKEVSKLVGVSLRFLKNFSYEHDIEFVDSKARQRNDSLTPVFICEEPPSPLLVQFLSCPLVSTGAAAVQADKPAPAQDESSDAANCAAPAPAPAEVGSEAATQAPEAKETVEADQVVSEAGLSESRRYGAEAPQTTSKPAMNMIATPNPADEGFDEAATGIEDLLTMEPAPDTSDAPPTPTASIPSSVVALPECFRNKTTKVAAWNAWYGNLKAVGAVFEQICKAKVPGLGDTRRLGTFPPAMALSTWFTTKSCVDAIFQQIPGARDTLFPRSRLASQLKQLLGDELVEIQALTQAKPITDVAKSVEVDWSWMSRLIDRGLLFRPLASQLLTLAALLRGADQDGLSASDRHRFDMAMTCILEDLPPTLAGVIAGSTPRISATGYKVKDGYSVDLEAWPQKIWETLGGEVFNQCVQQLEANLRSHLAGIEAQSPTETKIDRVETSLLVSRGESMALGEIGDDFIRATAAPNWNALLDSLESYSATIEIPLNSGIFSRDLFANRLPALPAPTAEAAQLLRNAIVGTRLIDEPHAFNGRSAIKMEHVHQVQEQIKQLGTDLTAANMLKLAELAEQGRTKILASREWFESEIKTYEAEVQHWKSFFAEWEQLASPPVQTVEPVKSKPKDKPQQMPGAVPESAVVSGLRADLARAQERNQNLDSELRAARSESHRLKLVVESRPDLAQQGAPEVDHALLRRVATRKGMTPVDVLTYIQAVSGVRVEVLDSAWKSAKAAERFTHPERMLDLLDLLVNPYFESLAAGNPDSVARVVMGNAYVAKESDTTMSNQKLRAMREFTYQGERMLFERHLRIGTSVGSRECMRIYFQIIDSTVVIAYAGEHLEITTTN